MSFNITYWPTYFTLFIQTQVPFLTHFFSVIYQCHRSCSIPCTFIWYVTYKIMYFVWQKTNYFPLCLAYFIYYDDLLFHLCCDWLKLINTYVHIPYFLYAFISVAEHLGWFHNVATVIGDTRDSKYAFISVTWWLEVLWENIQEGYSRVTWQLYFQFFFNKEASLHSQW